MVGLQHTKKPPGVSWWKTYCATAAVKAIFSNAAKGDRRDGKVKGKGKETLQSKQELLAALSEW